MTNDMRRVVSGKTDSLNNDSHNKHLDVCLLFTRFTQRTAGSRNQSHCWVSSCEETVALCYDCCKALRASGLCNVFDMGDIFFSCIVTTCKQLLYGWETISSRERYWQLAGSPLPVTLKNVSIQLSILDTLNLYFKYHTALLNNWTSKQRQ